MIRWSVIRSPLVAAGLAADSRGAIPLQLDRFGANPQERVRIRASRVPDTLTPTPASQVTAADVTSAMNQTNDCRRAVTMHWWAPAWTARTSAPPGSPWHRQYSNPGDGRTATINTGQTNSIGRGRRSDRRAAVLLASRTGGDATRSARSATDWRRLALVKDARARLPRRQEPADQYAQLSGLRLAR